MSKSTPTGLAGIIGKIVKDKGPDYTKIHELFKANPDGIKLEDILALIKLKSIRIVDGDTSCAEVRYDTVDRFLSACPDCVILVGTIPTGEDAYVYYPREYVGDYVESEDNGIDRPSIGQVGLDGTFLITGKGIIVHSSRHLPMGIRLV